MSDRFLSLGVVHFHPPGELQSNRQGLVGVYEKTGGRRWRKSNGWLKEADLGRWYGVISQGEGVVISLILSENALRGEYCTVAPHPEST